MVTIHPPHPLRAAVLLALGCFMLVAALKCFGAVDFPLTPRELFIVVVAGGAMLVSPLMFLGAALEISEALKPRPRSPPSPDSPAQRRC